MPSDTTIRSAKREQTITYTYIACGECGLNWAVNRVWLDERRDDGKTFYCPNGHSRRYHKTTEEVLREDLEAERAWSVQKQAALDRARAEAKHQAARANGMKGQLQRTKNRQAKGVCPSCNRHFANVERHMAGQHPDYPKG